MSNVVDGPSPHRVPCKGPFSRVPECACDPGSGMSRAEMEKRIAELEAALLQVREAFDDDAGMAILIDRVLSGVTE